MIYKSLRLDVSDGIARLTLADPSRGNPVDGDMCRDLRDAAGRLAATDVRAVLLSAEGPAFSYGGDISAFIERLGELPQTIGRWVADLNRAVLDLQSIDAPVVAAVHGICAGGMVGVAAGADVVVASDDARFLAAYAGIAFCCDGGSSVMVGRRIGAARARRFFIMNETIDAAAGLQIGLVDEIVPRRSLEDRAVEIATRLSRGPTRAFGETRRLLSSAQVEPLEVQLGLEAEALVRCAGRDEAREGIAAFAERRQPSFAQDG